MALPSVGNPLSFDQIRTELGLSQSNSSLRSMSNDAGKSVPDAVSEFYGFSNSISLSVTAQMVGYGYVYTTGYQNSEFEWYLNAMAQSGYSYNYSQNSSSVTVDPGVAVQINVSATAYWNYIGVQIYTDDAYIYGAYDFNYGTITTTQYKTFTSANSTGNTNNLNVVAYGYNTLSGY
jgi:hypothetical protein